MLRRSNHDEGVEGPGLFDECDLELRRDRIMAGRAGVRGRALFSWGRLLTPRRGVVLEVLMIPGPERSQEHQPGVPGPNQFVSSSGGMLPTGRDAAGNLFSSRQPVSLHAYVYPRL